MQATEALKIALGIGRPLMGRYYVYYALQGASHLITIEKNPACPLCGKNPTIRAFAAEGTAQDQKGG
jgi:molybdopterin/thiamine biosynthesis adenylyltransferase